MKERLGIRAASAMGIPYGIAEEQFDISRTHYYELGKKADSVLESLTASEETTERVIVINKAFRERFVLAQMCYGNTSVSNIIAIYRQVFQAPLSKGTVYNHRSGREPKSGGSGTERFTGEYQGYCDVSQKRVK